jgi:trimeric autotransporter adhesin
MAGQLNFTPTYVKLKDANDEQSTNQAINILIDDINKLSSAIQYAVIKGFGYNIFVSPTVGNFTITGTYSCWVPGTPFAGDITIQNSTSLYGAVLGLDTSGNFWIQSGCTGTATYNSILLNPSGGGVGIGVAPISATRLYVYGSAKIGGVINQGVWLESTGSPDYGSQVFLPNDLGAQQGAVRLRSAYTGIGTTGYPNFEISRSTTTQAYASDPSQLTYTSSFSIDGCSGNITIPGAANIQTLTVGLGGSNVSNNTAVGYCALQAATSTSCNNSAFGYQSLYSNTYGSNNSAFGFRSLYAITTGNNNSAVGLYALCGNVTASLNVAMGLSSSRNVCTGCNTSVGACSLFGCSTLACNTGYYNSAFGYGALYSFNGIGGCWNTAIGVCSLCNNTIGAANTAVGMQSMACNTTGIQNSVLGMNALYYNVSGTDNVAVGFDAMIGSSGQSNSQNTAIGSCALCNITTGTGNVATGFLALFCNCTGSYNTAVGISASQYNCTGQQNVAVGINAAAFINTSYNTAVGSCALEGNTTSANNTGIGNTAIGNWSMLGTVSGISGGYNTAVGTNTLQCVTSGCYNIAVGAQALYYGCTGCYNTAVGTCALVINSTGNNNVAIGTRALVCSVGGSCNVAVGYASLGQAATTCPYNETVAIGAYAMQCFCNCCNCSGAGVGNTAVGSYSLRCTYGTNANNSGSYNTAVGYCALQANTTGSYNTAFGYQSLYTNASGIYNTAFGLQALCCNSIGTYNTAVGVNALTANTTGINNSAFGTCSLAANTTGINNSAFGTCSLAANTTGYYNTAIGLQSLFCNVCGSCNTALGVNALCANTTACYAIGIGYNAGANCCTNISCIAFIGDAAACPAAINKIYSCAAGVTTYSDIRFKCNITEIKEGLTLIKDIQPISYYWKKEEGCQKLALGFAAQCVNKVFNCLNSETLNLLKHNIVDEPINGENPDAKVPEWGINTINFVPFMINAIKELDKKIERIEQHLSKEN